MALGCEVSYSAIHFGTVYVGDYDDQLFKITNTGESGDGNLTGTVSVPGPDFSIQGTATYDLGPSEEQWFTIRFAPQSSGFKDETVETGDALCADLDVDGTGNDTPVCSLLNTSLDFGELEPEDYSDLTIRITNNGGGTLSGSVSMASGENYFSLLESDLSYSLTHGQYAEFTVRFEPDGPGIFTGSVETGNATCADISLSGMCDYAQSTPYLLYAGESSSAGDDVTVYLDLALVVPFPVDHEVPATVSRTEDKKLKVYKHELGGDRKRTWVVTAWLKIVDSPGYRWMDLENFYCDHIEGPLKQFTFCDNFNQTYTVRMVGFGPPEFHTRNLVKIRMVMEEDYE